MDFDNTHAYNKIHLYEVEGKKKIINNWIRLKWEEKKEMKMKIQLPLPQTVRIKIPVQHFCSATKHTFSIKI